MSRFLATSLAFTSSLLLASCSLAVCQACPEPVAVEVSGLRLDVTTLLKVCWDNGAHCTVLRVVNDEPSPSLSSTLASSRWLRCVAFDDLASCTARGDEVNVYLREAAKEAAGKQVEVTIDRGQPGANRGSAGFIYYRGDGRKCSCSYSYAIVRFAPGT